MTADLAKIVDVETEVDRDVVFYTKSGEYRVRAAVCPADIDTVLALRFESYNALGYYGDGPGKLKHSNHRELPDEFETRAQSFLLEASSGTEWQPIGTVRIIEDVGELPADNMYDLSAIRSMGKVTEASRWIVTEQMRNKSCAYLLAGVVMTFSLSLGARNNICSAVPEDVKMHTRHFGSKVVLNFDPGSYAEVGIGDENFDRALVETTQNYDVSTPTVLLRWDLPNTPQRFLYTLERMTGATIDTIVDNMRRVQTIAAFR